MSVKRRRFRVDESDKVGYGKPPLHSRFTRGQSGNPKGRPKGVRNFKTDVKATLEAPVKVTREGKPRKVSTQEAMLLRLREKALSGDSRALDRLIQLAQTYNEDELAASVGWSAEDTKLLRIYNGRLLSGAATGFDLIEGNDKSERDSTGSIALAKAAEETPKTRVQVKRYRPSDDKPSADDLDEGK